MCCPFSFLLQLLWFEYSRFKPPESNIPQMAFASSSSLQASPPALAPAQGNAALAPAQGNIGESLTIASYNLGVRDAQTCCSKKIYPMFLDKLKRDVCELRAHSVDVLCFQELNDRWREQLDTILSCWERASSQAMTTSTYVRPGFTILKQAEHSIFPDSNGKSGARRVLQTVVGRPRSCPSAEQQTWNIWNNHTVSGSKAWRITGDIGRFCTLTLTNVMRLALASAQGNTKQCVVLLGD